MVNIEHLQNTDINEAEDILKDKKTDYETLTEYYPWTKEQQKSEYEYNMTNDITQDLLNNLNISK